MLLSLRLIRFLPDTSFFSICSGFWQRSQVTPTLLTLPFHPFSPHLNFVIFLGCHSCLLAPSHNVSLWLTITWAIINYHCIWALEMHMLHMGSRNPYSCFHPYSFPVLVLSLNKQKPSLMIHDSSDFTWIKVNLWLSSPSPTSFLLSWSNITTLEVCSCLMTHSFLAAPHSVVRVLDNIPPFYCF